MSSTAGVIPWGVTADGLEVIDLRGLPMGDPRRKAAYPVEPPPRPLPGYRHLFEPMRYIHLVNVHWYFDASDPRNAVEGDNAVARVMESASRQSSGGYTAFRVVVDNYGATVIGRREEV